MTGCPPHQQQIGQSTALYTLSQLMNSNFLYLYNSISNSLCLFCCYNSTPIETCEITDLALLNSSNKQEGTQQAKQLRHCCTLCSRSFMTTGSFPPPNTPVLYMQKPIQSRCVARQTRCRGPGGVATIGPD